MSALITSTSVFNSEINLITYKTKLLFNNNNIESKIFTIIFSHNHKAHLIEAGYFSNRLKHFY